MNSDIIFFVYSLIAFFFVINIIVVIHEFGHYLAARKCGVKVERFSLGMGPEICGFTDKHGTRWMLSAFPVGGYVMMLGDADAASVTEDKELYEKLNAKEKKQSIFAKSNLEKIFISFCGPFFNYLYAIVILFCIGVFHGAPVMKPEVGAVIENSAAQKAGFLKGDMILLADGKEVKDYRDIQMAVFKSAPGSSINFVIERAGNLQNISVVPEVRKKKGLLGEKKEKILGIASGLTTFEEKSVSDAFYFAVDFCMARTLEFVQVFKRLFTGAESCENLHGIVHMANVSGHLLADGRIFSLIMFTVVLSLNLGFVNLLPLPVLDGGNIVICAIEGIFRRKLNDKFKEYLMGTFAIFLIGLMLFTIINDAANIEAVKNLLNKVVG